MMRIPILSRQLLLSICSNPILMALDLPLRGTRPYCANNWLQVSITKPSLRGLLCFDTTFLAQLILILTVSFNQIALCPAWRTRRRGTGMLTCKTTPSIITILLVILWKANAASMILVAKGWVKVKELIGGQRNYAMNWMTLKNFQLIRNLRWFQSHLFK